MIDIAFDMHQDNTFCGEAFSVIKIENELISWADYKNFAQLFIQQHAQEKTVVVNVVNNHFSINKFSVALFVSSFNLSCPLNLVVFKVDDLEQAREDYKPYLALTVALKYVLQLINEPAETIYKNVSILGYLGILVKSDYINHSLLLEYHGATNEKTYEFEGHNPFEALLYAGVLKTAALAHLPLNLKIKLIMNLETQKIDMNKLADQIVQHVSLWLQ